MANVNADTRIVCCKKPANNVPTHIHVRPPHKGLNSYPMLLRTFHSCVTRKRKNKARNTQETQTAINPGSGSR